MKDIYGRIARQNLGDKLQFACSWECKRGEKRREETDCPPLSSL